MKISKEQATGGEKRTKMFRGFSEKKDCANAYSRKIITAKRGEWGRSIPYVGKGGWGRVGVDEHFGIKKTIFLAGTSPLPRSSDEQTIMQNRAARYPRILPRLKRKKQHKHHAVLFAQLIFFFFNHRNVLSVSLLLLGILFPNSTCVSCTTDSLGGRLRSFLVVRLGAEAHDLKRRSHQALRSQFGSAG